MTAVEGGIQEIKGSLDRLERLLERVDARLTKIEVEALPRLAADIAELKGRVSQLPTTVVLIGFALAVLAAGGLMRQLFP